MARRRAHRRQVAQVGGERLVPDVGGGGVGAVEVDSLHQGVRGHDGQGAAVRLEDGGVVPDAGHHAGGARAYPFPDALNDGVLAEIGDGGGAAHDRWMRG